MWPQTPLGMGIMWTSEGKCAAHLIDTPLTLRQPDMERDWSAFVLRAASSPVPTKVVSAASLKPGASIMSSEERLTSRAAMMPHEVTSRWGVLSIRRLVSRVGRLRTACGKVGPGEDRTREVREVCEAKSREMAAGWRGGWVSSKSRVSCEREHPSSTEDMHSRSDMGRHMEKYFQSYFDEMKKVCHKRHTCTQQSNIRCGARGGGGRARAHGHV